MSKNIEPEGEIKKLEFDSKSWMQKKIKLSPIEWQHTWEIKNMIALRDFSREKLSLVEIVYSEM